MQPIAQQHQTLIVEEFEPDVFRQLIEYIHTGCVTLQPRTLLGEESKKLNSLNIKIFSGFDRCNECSRLLWT